MPVDPVFGVDFAKVLMGQNAFHIAMNLLVQTYDDGKTAAGVFQTKDGAPLYAGSKRSHVLLLGDMTFRPRMILATDGLRGRGISNLFTDGFGVEEWSDADKILVPDSVKKKKGG